MRLFLRAGVMLGLAALAACGKDSPSPVDFNDPAAVSANLSSVDSAFDSDAFRSFTLAILHLDVAAPQPAIKPAATVLTTLRPGLERTGGSIFMPGLRQARKLQSIIPNLSVSAAQGRIIPDSLYGRVFEWNATTDSYEYQGNTVPNLTGVRFVLYALDLGGAVVEPVSPIGTLDIIDQSTPSQLRLQVFVKNSAGTTTYVDYNAALQVIPQTSLNAEVTGSISNGLSGADNKTLSFDQTFTINGSGANIHATFALNNPALTLLMNESVTFSNPNVVITADFRIIQNGETIRTWGRITLNTADSSVDVIVRVFVDGHPVASVNGDPADPATQWVDAGGEPLTLEDLAALDQLFDAWTNFQLAVEGLFTPIGIFAAL